jgi:predicted secreted protein
MATLTGNNGVVKIDNAAGTPTAVAAVRSFTCEMTADTIETSNMGQDTRRYVKGMSTWSGSADIYFDPAEFPTANSGFTALNPTGQTTGTPWRAVGSDTVTVELYLDGTSNKFIGEAIITGFTVNSSFDGMVEASISFQGSGSVAFSV